MSPTSASNGATNRLIRPRYFRLLQASYQGIKSANPAAMVLAGALAPTLESRGSSAGLNDLDFLRDLYALGASSYFDALAIHSYGLRESPRAEPASDRLNFRRAELLREIHGVKWRSAQTGIHHREWLE